GRRGVARWLAALCDAYAKPRLRCRGAQWGRPDSGVDLCAGPDPRRGPARGSAHGREHKGLNGSGRMPQVPGALPSFTPGKVLATGLDGLQGLHRVGEGLDTDHFQFTVGGGLGDLGTTFRRHEEVLRPGTLGTDHLLRNTADPADLARGGDGPRTGDLRAPGDALLAEPVHDPEREHQSRARATDVADADVHVDGEVGVVGDEDPHHGGALVTLLAGDLDLDGLTVPV